MNVKNRALLIVCGLILTLAGFFLYVGINDHNRGIVQAITDEERIIDGTFEDIQQYVFSPYRVRIEQIVRNNPGIRKAFAERDRERLYRLTRPIYDDLTEENGYFHAFDFNLPDGTVFLRVQKPGLHGDKINLTRSIVQSVHEEKKQRAGYDIGKHGAMYWIAQPVFHDGKYIGAMEIGIHVDQVTFALADRFRTEVTTIINEDAWQKATSIESGFKKFGSHYVMMDKGSIYTMLPDDIDFSRSQEATFVVNGRPHVLHVCAGLYNNKGRKLGSILIAQDISAQIANKRAFIGYAVAVTAVLLTVSFAVLYFMFGSLIGKLEMYARANKRAKEELEKAKEVLEVRVSERTDELAKANASLKDQHRFLQTIIESLTQPFYVIDAESYRIILANSAAYGGADRKDAGLTCYQMTHKQDKPCSGDDHPCAIKEVKRTKQPVTLEHTHVNHNGVSQIMEIYAYPVLDNEGELRHVIEYCIDITERIKAEEEKKKMLTQLNHMQKMEAIGALAGGVAHDFNNILAAILGYTDLARRKVPEGSEVQGMLMRVLEAGDRAKHLVRQILSFSKQTEQTLAPIKIQDVVHEALRLLRASLPATIELRQDIDETSDHVLADSTQIHQVVMNLGTNAYHAMREKGGVLGVSVKQVTVGPDTHKSASMVLAPGDYVKLEVSDTGHGIEPDILKRIFEPYFTTKKPGEGTGMGLAVAHGIVKSHGGQITVYSVPRVGTTFNVYLPQIKSVSMGMEMQASAGDGQSTEPLPGGAERILFVDDEVQLTEMGRNMLESLGYRVSPFNDSLEALSAFQNDPEAFDLVITDMTMPNMTGVDLAKQLLAIRRDMPIVLCTGFSELINAQKAKEIGIREYVMKPILMNDIARLIRSILDGKKV